MRHSKYRSRRRRRNPFMTPEYARECMWVLDTNYGGVVVPDEAVSTKRPVPPKRDWMRVFGDYIEGDRILDVDKECGWWARLSASGYMDATDWDGPYDTLEEAKEALERMHDVDPDTGEELD